MDGAPIFDVYDDEEPSLAVQHEAVKEEFVALEGMRSIEDLKVNVLHEVYDEFQKMKVSMMQEFISLQETMNRVLKKLRNFSTKTGGDNAQQSSQHGTRSHHTNQNRRVYMDKPSRKRSATSSRRHRRARTVPIKRQRQHPASQTRKPRRMSRSNSSKPRIGVNSTKPPEYGDLPQSPSLRWRFRLSSHVFCRCVEVVLSLAGRDGINRKRPFDRGRACLRTLRTRFFGGWSIDEFITGVNRDGLVRLWHHMFSYFIGNVSHSFLTSH